MPKPLLPKGQGRTVDTRAGREGPASRYLNKESGRQPGSAESPNHQARPQQ